MNDLNIYQRINEIRKKVDYIQKDKKVSTGAGSYNAVTHDAVTAMIRDHLIEYGVICVPTLVASHNDPKDVNKEGEVAKQFRYVATYSFDFVNMDKPEEKITIVMEAHAMDNADKAPGKAISYAKKYAVLKLFEIETGDDDESRFASDDDNTPPYLEFSDDVEKIKATDSIKALSLLWAKMGKKPQFFLEIVKNEQKVKLMNKEAQDKKAVGAE